MFIFVDQPQKSLDRAHLGHRIILVPLQIGPLPIDQPRVARLQISRFSDRFFDSHFRVVPARPDLEYFDVPAVETEAEIDLVTEVKRRPVFRDESRDGMLDALFLDIIHQNGCSDGIRGRCVSMVSSRVTGLRSAFQRRLHQPECTKLVHCEGPGRRRLGNVATAWLWRQAALRWMLIAMIALSATACCTALRSNEEAEIIANPAVVIRGVLAGWTVTSSIATKPRQLDTWEVRISLEGRTQESRGWKSSDGFLPIHRISPSEARGFYEAARGLSALPDWVGRYATDTPYRQIEFTVDGVTRTIIAFPGSPDDADLALFDRVWNQIAKCFPERKVCAN